VSVRVRLVPRGGRDAVVGERDGAILGRVSAPPVDGRANAALIALVAKALGVPKGDVEIAVGAAARDKAIRVHGLDDEAVRARLLAIAG